MANELISTGLKTESGYIHYALNESLIEQIWRDLHGKVPREEIHQVATEVANEFKDATIKTFVSIFIRRRTREELIKRNNGQE